MTNCVFCRIVAGDAEDIETRIRALLAEKNGTAQ